jgi:hypothetical protein
VRTSRSNRAVGPALLRLEQPEEWHRDTAPQASAIRSNTRSVRTGKVSKATVEHKVRKVWRPGMSIGQLERAAGISHNSAGKWRKVLIAEAQEPLQAAGSEAAQ